MLNIGKYSFRKKLTWMNLLVSGATLLIASSAFVAYELATLTREMVRNLSIQAQIAGANSASAILFGDPESARNTLSALKATPNLVSVTLYTPAGNAFASYMRVAGVPEKPALPVTAGPAERHRFTTEALFLTHPVIFQGELIGTVYIHSDLRDIYGRVLRYGGIVVVILLVSVPVALMFSTIFQRAIARPILQLAGVARVVSREKQYGLRVPESVSEDEISLLIRAFNDMLAQIQERDAALQQAHERLHLALKSSGVGTWSRGIGDDSVTWDDYMYPLFGLQPGTPVPDQETFLNLIHPKDRDLVRAAADESVTSGLPYDVEFRVIWPDGSVRSLSARGRVFRDLYNRPARFTGVCWDVTERRRAEEERQKFVSLVEQTDDFIGMFGLEGKVMFVNRSGCRLVGLKPDNAPGTFFADLYPKDSWKRLSEEVLPAISRGKGNWVGEAQLRHIGTHQAIDVLMNVFPVNDPESGQLLCFAAIIRDVTERKRLEQQVLQSQKLDSIGQLAGGVAHDFNNLLTIISGYSELILSRTDPNDPVCEPVEQISRAAARAAALTRQLLAFGSRQPVEQRDVYLSDVVSNVEKMLRRLIGEDVELIISTDNRAGMMHADPGQIEQVIVNLVINARDAMPEGGRLLIETARIDVHAESAPGPVAVAPGHYVMLAVSDTGTGMTDEVKARVFEPFFTTKERGKGTGLGLSTVYGIVQQNNGYISVQSEAGRGTTFRLLFPVVDVPPELAAGSTGPEALSSVANGDETILLCEDEAGVLGYIRYVLERQGYRVVEASNGLEAMDIIHRYPGPVHILVTDVVMPEVGGVELAAEFARIYPGRPILYMSGYADRLWLQNNSGVNFIQKPFASPVLLSRIRELLDARNRVPERQPEA